MENYFQLDLAGKGAAEVKRGHIGTQDKIGPQRVAVFCSDVC